jgi:RNA polymerase-binding transcription factor DksA
MSREERGSQAAMTGELAAGTRGPRWRALLETRWQARVREVTELSLAYHVGAVAARRKLADLEEALGRLAAGRFGSCEECGSAIPAVLLAATPETRYCPRCDAEPVRVRAAAGRLQR